MNKHRFAVTAVIFAVALVLSSCADDDDKDNAAVPDPSTTSTTEAVTTTTSPALSEESKLTLDGLGGLKAGQTIEEAAALTGVKISEERGGIDDESCLYGVLEGAPEGVSILTENHVVARVDVFGNPAIATEAGVRVDSTEDEVRRAYPTIKVTNHEYEEGGHYMTYRDPAQPDKSILFETDGTKVTAMRSGRADFVDFVEGCS